MLADPTMMYSSSTETNKADYMLDRSNLNHMKHALAVWELKQRLGDNKQFQ
jgi:hypothetical protein